MDNSLTVFVNSTDCGDRLLSAWLSVHGEGLNGFSALMLDGWGGTFMANVLYEELPFFLQALSFVIYLLI